MITPVLTFWWRLFTTLALEVCCLAALGFAAQRLARSAFWRRAAWQVTVVCLLAAAVSEWTGVGRAMAMHFAPRAQAVENKPTPNITPAPLGNPVEVQMVAMRPPTPEKQAVAVWWPGLIGLAGTVLLLGRTALAQGLLLALRFGRNKITDEPLRQKLAHLAPRVGLRRKVCLRRMSALASPMAFGIFRPCIGLPAQFETKFSPAEQDAILAHESAHLAARDPLWFLLADLAVAVLWWHPAAWWARQRLHVISEQAADEATALVPDGPRALAQCLVALGKEMADVGAWGWVGINGGAFRSKLGRRVEGLLQLSGGPTPPLHGRGARAIKIAAMLTAAPLTVLAFGSMQTTQAPSDETWRFQLEKSWRQSPAGVMLLAKQDDQATTPKTNRVEKLPSDMATHSIPTTQAQPDASGQDDPVTTEVRQNGGTNTDEGVWVENFTPVMPTGSGAIEVTNIVILSRGINRTNQQENFNLAYAVAQFLTNSASVTNPVRSEISKQHTIQNGKFLYEMGRLDEAEIIFKRILKDDPSNRSVLYYLDLVKEARYFEAERKRGEAAKSRIRSGVGEFVVNHGTNLIMTSKSRQRILSKLDTIMLDDVSYKDMPLKEVVRDLRDESVKHDPDGIGVNFMINNASVDVSSGLPPSTVPGAAPAAVPQQDIGAEVTIRISPPLKNLRLGDALEAVTKTANHPIRYTIEDYAVVFSPKTAETNVLYTKRFRVNPNSFVQALQNLSAIQLNLGTQAAAGKGGGSNSIGGTIPQVLVAPVQQGGQQGGQGQQRQPGLRQSGLPYSPATNSTAQEHAMVRAYFTAAGIDFSPPKLIFWNDRLGELLVKATLSDLETIQEIIGQINQSSPNNADADSK